MIIFSFFDCKDPRGKHRHTNVQRLLYATFTNHTEDLSSNYQFHPYLSLMVCEWHFDSTWLMGNQWKTPGKINE